MFTPHVREYEPLENLLIDYARTARSGVPLLPGSAFESGTDEELVETLLRDWRALTLPRPSRSGQPEARPEPIPVERRGPKGERVQYWQWTLVFPIAGNTDLACRWPAHFDGPPCEDDRYAVPAPQFCWERTDRGALAKCDVSRDEDPDGSAPPSASMVEAGHYLDRALEFIVLEVEAYEQQLRAEVLEGLARRRSRLGSIENELVRVLDLLRVDMPPIETEIAASIEESPSTLRPSDDAEVVVNLVLGASTFIDFVRVVRRWGSGVERYPAAYVGLKEEILSSHLVNTLNIVFVTAGREVFQGKGKTDIFVLGRDGEKPLAAHIGEAKIWSGEGSVRSAIDQLLGYALARTRELLLIWYVEEQKLQVIEDRGWKALPAKCADLFEKFGEDEDGARVALLHHPKFATPILLTMVFVHVPALK